MSEISAPESIPSERLFPAKQYLDTKNTLQTGLIKQGLPPEQAEIYARQNAVRTAIPTAFGKEIDKVGFALDWHYLSNVADLSNENVQSALHLLNDLSVNPSLLDSYPSQDDASEDQITEWCKNTGLKDPQILNIKFPPNILAGMLTVPRAQEFSVPEEMQRTLEDLLSILQFVRDEKKYLHEVKIIAANNLEKYFPEWLPTEPVQVVFEYKNIGSEYYGKVRGIHYMVLNPLQYQAKYSGRIPFSNIYRTPHTLNKTKAGIFLTHEMVHQSDVEKNMGTLSVLGYDTDSFFSDEEASKFTAREIVKRIRERKESISHDSRNLGQVITEGIATSIEMSISSNEVKAREGQTDNIAEAYREHLVVRSGYLDTSRANAKWNSHYNPYRIGVDILDQLVDDEKQLVSLSQQINRARCFEISYLDPQFDKFIHNPSMIHQL